MVQILVQFLLNHGLLVIDALVTIEQDDDPEDGFDGGAKTQRIMKYIIYQEESKFSCWNKILICW